MGKLNPLNAELNPICHLLALLGVHHFLHVSRIRVNPLNPELNPICYLLALLGAHHFLHVSRIRIKLLTLGY
jgi:transposase